MPTPIILDCDPGHDDAIAIVVAARHTELLGITTVAGNGTFGDTGDGGPATNATTKPATSQPFSPTS